MLQLYEPIFFLFLNQTVEVDQTYCFYITSSLTNQIRFTSLFSSRQGKQTVCKNRYSSLAFFSLPILNIIMQSKKLKVQNTQNSTKTNNSQLNTSQTTISSRKQMKIFDTNYGKYNSKILNMKNTNKKYIPPQKQIEYIVLDCDTNFKINEFVLQKYLKKSELYEFNQYQSKTKQIYTIKIQKTKTLQQKKMVKQIQNEIDILRKFKDNNQILKLINHSQDNINVYLIFGNIKGENLLNLIKKLGKNFDEDECKKIIKQVIEVLQYIHEQGVIYRNLKLENVYIEEDRILLTNFEHANYYQQNSNRLTIFEDQPETPEILQQTNQSEKVDIFQLGLLICDILDESKNVFLTKQNILDCNYHFPETFTPSLKDLLKQIFVKNENQRICLEQILQHHWLDENYQFEENLNDEANEFPADKNSVFEFDINISTEGNIRFSENIFQENFLKQEMMQEKFSIKQNTDNVLKNSQILQNEIVQIHEELFDLKSFYYNNRDIGFEDFSAPESIKDTYDQQKQLDILKNLIEQVDQYSYLIENKEDEYNQIKRQNYILESEKQDLNDKFRIILELKKKKNIMNFTNQQLLESQQMNEANRKSLQIPSILSDRMEFLEKIDINQLKEYIEEIKKSKFYYDDVLSNRSRSTLASKSFQKIDSKNLFEQEKLLKNIELESKLNETKLQISFQEQKNQILQRFKKQKLTIQQQGKEIDDKIKYQKLQIQSNHLLETLEDVLEEKNLFEIKLIELEKKKKSLEDFYNRLQDQLIPI